MVLTDLYFHADYRYIRFRTTNMQLVKAVGAIEENSFYVMYATPESIQRLVLFIKLNKLDGDETTKNILRYLREQYEVLTRKRNKITELKYSLEPQIVYSPILRYYQNIDVQMCIHEFENPLILNEQRTGKTMTCIHALKNMPIHARTSIVIADSALILNWESAFQASYPETKLFVARGSAVARRKVYEQYNNYTSYEKVLLVSLKCLVNDLTILRNMNFYNGVIDEAHLLRSYKSNQSKALHVIRERVIKRWLLTATPAINNSTEIFNLLKFCYPRTFYNYNLFLNYFYTVKQDRLGNKIAVGVKPDRVTEMTLLLDVLSTQRKREDVFDFKAPIQTYSLLLKQDEYQELTANNLLEYMEDPTMEIDCINTGVQVTRLTEVGLDMRLCSEKAKEVLPSDYKSPKTKCILKVIEKAKAKNYKVIVVSKYTSYLELLKTVIPDAFMFTGNETTDYRELVKKKFQETDEVNIILANFRIFKEGHDFDMCNYLVFPDKDFAEGMNQQAVDRISCFRATTADRERIVLNLSMNNLWEEHIEELIKNKKISISSVNNYRGIKELLMKKL